MSKFGEGLGQISLKNWTTVPIEQLTTPPKSGLYSVKVNEWWVVDKNGDVLMYEGKTPQCNAKREICEFVYSDHPLFGGVVQIPLAMFPINPKDY